MPISFLPTYRTWSVTNLTPQWLQRQGIRLLMLDFDNTIVPYTTDIPTKRMEDWLREMQASPVRICVVSNSRNGRVWDFCEKYDIPCIMRAGKPGTRGIMEAVHRFGAAREQAVLVGDQIFTDVLGGNRAWIKTILVKPIRNHNIWLKLRHLAEQPFIFAARKRRIYP